MNCSTCTVSPYFDYAYNKNDKYKLVDICSNKISNNLNGLIYMIMKEGYYMKIINAVNKSAEYKKNNKRYYFSFYSFDDKKNYLFDSNDIYLAKNNINNYDKYQEHIRYKLYQDRYTNVSVNDRYGCSNTRNTLIKYDRINNKEVNKCYKDCNIQLRNLGYCSVSKTNLDNYMNQYNQNIDDPCSCKRINNVDKIYLSNTDINNKKKAYDQFRKEYYEACYYNSYIKSRIRQIKNTSLEARKANICVKLNKLIFPNIPLNELKHVYSSQEILIVYNTILQKIK